MPASPWDRLAEALPAVPKSPWLDSLLAANAGTRYLRAHGSPRDETEFRARIPVVSHQDLLPDLLRIQDGAADVLFAGRPVAYERTSGSAGGAKVIPYSAAGLDDFRGALIPWLIDGTRRYHVTGRAYFSISPATRPPEHLNGVPVGLSDAAYLGDAAAQILGQVAAVPFGIAAITDVGRWRQETLAHLAAARDLEFISCWSPTFLLRLLDDLPDPREIWPQLKLVSCWADAGSSSFAAQLAERVAHAHVQPKGLISTECAVSIPDSSDRAVLSTRGFFEFEREGIISLAHRLEIGSTYEVIATTASGLYRYRTGDRVCVEAYAPDGRPYLTFVGRSELTSDLVGEKLTETFVAECLGSEAGFRMLLPAAGGDGYVLAADTDTGVDVNVVEQRLCRNPQYAHARRIGQLQAVRLVELAGLYDRYVDVQLRRGVRLGDVKPLSLRIERNWLENLGVHA